MTVSNILMCVVLVIQSALIVTIVLVLYAVLRQGRRITRMAEHAQELAQQAEVHARHAEETAGHEDGPPPPAGGQQ